jgi:sigma-B regulation protein RsbU (phosphoserine phosphatase)
MNLGNHSLARRMAALILLGAGLVLLLVLGFSHLAQRRRILAAAEDQSRTLAQSVMFQIEAQLSCAAAAVQQTALFLAEKDIVRSESVDLIRRTLEAQPTLFGMAVALPETAAVDRGFKILYGWREGGQVTVQDRPAVLQDYQHDWLVLPTQLRRNVWVEPYYDDQAKATMVTYSVPVLRADEVVAVVTCDISLADIRAVLAKLPLGEGGMTVLLSRRGTFIAHTERPALEMKETIFSLAEAQKIPEVGRTLAQLGHNMLSGVPGHMRYRRPFGDDLRMAHMYYTTVPCTGWALGLFRPEAQVLAPLVRLNQISALVALASLALLLIPALGIAWSVSRPLHRLAAAAQRLATGDFEAPLPPVRSQDEVGQLTKAFAQMRQDLRHYIADLTATTAAKERIAGELSAAREIQMSIVPKLFPPLFPSRPEIDLHALLIPAREVGGDLYDFLLLDDDHLYIAIGDVSGKGVPASLLMAVGKTLLKSTTQTVRAPARALAQVNQELSEGNDSCMFITMFCGILNLKTGNLIYANAGHNPPFLARGSGAIERLDEPPGPALGIVPGVVYEDRSRHLHAGDLLVLYTDGVTEAMNPANVMFEEDGLLAHIRRDGQQSAKLFLEGLARAVHAHAAGAEQSDDITALALRFRASPTAAASPLLPAASTEPAADATLCLRNQVEELSRLATWIEELGEAQSVPPAVLMSLNLALEEWVVNVISYAYADTAEHMIELRLWRGQGEWRIDIEDDGRPFDPTAQAEADTTLPIEHRQIGGLGIHFIRNTMDHFGYRREQNHNLITIVKRLTPESV